MTDGNASISATTNAYEVESHIRRDRKLARFLARGERISAELLAFAAGARQRIEAIDAEHPDTG